MKIIYKKVSDLVPYENNPRKNDKAVDFVANSIKEFGFKNPIVISKDNVIAAGHTRLKAAISLGMTEVPCIVADDLTEEQLNAFRLADNKVSELADWDFGKLELELDELDFDMTDFGFSEAEILEITVDDGVYTPYERVDSPTEYVRSDYSEVGSTKKEIDEELRQYERHADENNLMNKRVILVFKTDEEENFVKSILHLPDGEPLNVVYNVKDIIGRKNAKSEK